MRRTLCRLAAQRSGIESRKSPPLIQIKDANFYRHHPSSVASERTDAGQFVDKNPPLFPGLTFTLPSFSDPDPNHHWVILSNSSAARTTFLQVLRGQHICHPPTARSYPYLATDAIAQKDLTLRSPSHAIQYVGFDAERGNAGGGGMRGAYMSARYESRKEETDFSLKDFLLGNTELNADERLQRHPDQTLLEQVIANLKLGPMINMPVTHLSNGQTRRARIAKALLAKPELLLLDGPFMGLDPSNLKLLSSLLRDLAEAQEPRLILSLKPDEFIPTWITHMAYVNSKFELDSIGPREEVVEGIYDRIALINHREVNSKDPEAIKLRRKVVKMGQKLDRVLYENAEDDAELAEVGRHLRSNLGDDHDSSESRRSRAPWIKSIVPSEGMANTRELERGSFSRDMTSAATMGEHPLGEALIEMKGVKVQYGDKAVLGNWTQDCEGSERSGLWWTVSRGQRWGIFGPNGSGKTTLISLITSDHPQTYSLPITLFGRSRLPRPGQPGISIFDVQSRIGHSSPEVHTFFPKHLSLRRTVESAWADTPLTRPRLTHELDSKVTAALQWFRAELHPTLGPTQVQAAEMNRLSRFDQLSAARSNASTENSAMLRRIDQELAQEELDDTRVDWADNLRFGELSFSAQRVALFLRAVIRNPDIVILDEAFSGMDDFARDKCHLFLSRGESAIFKLRSPLSRGQQAPHRLRTKSGPRPVRSDISRLGRVKVDGLTKDQALIVIAHKMQEVPGCVHDWICLPEASEGAPPRKGHLTTPLEMDINGWRQIWGEPTVPKPVRDYNPQETEVPHLSDLDALKLNLRRMRQRKSVSMRTPEQNAAIEEMKERIQQLELETKYESPEMRDHIEREEKELTASQDFKPGTENVAISKNVHKEIETRVWPRTKNENDEIKDEDDGERVEKLRQYRRQRYQRIKHTETVEERAARLQSNRFAVAKVKKKASPETRERRRSYMRQYITRMRKNWTEKDWERQRVRDREYRAKRVSRETAEEKRRRLERQRVYNRKNWLARKGVSNSKET